MRQRHVTRRALVALSALVIHGVLFLVVTRVHTPPREAPILPQFVSLWLTQPAPEVAETPDTPAPSSSERPELPDRAAVTLAEATPVTSPDRETDDARAAVDWMREGSRVARSVGEALQKEKADGFSGAVPKMREACVPKETSFKWNPEEKRVGFSGGLPYVRLGNCVVGLGFFACSGKPQPNTHLFDDMVASNRQESSVPDPDFCD